MSKKSIFAQEKKNHKNKSIIVIQLKKIKKVKAKILFQS